MSLNNHQIIGHLGKDPEVKQVGENTVANFSVATSERYKDKKGEYQTVTEWHNVVVWNQPARYAEKFLKQGSHVYVQGKSTNRKYQAKDGSDRSVTEIKANVIKGLDKRGSTDSPTPSQAPRASAEDFDDLPF